MRGLKWEIATTSPERDCVASGSSDAWIGVNVIEYAITYNLVCKMMKGGMSMDTVSNETCLVQIEISASVREKLDEIFTKNGTTTPQGLKMIATQIANCGQSYAL